VDILGGEHVAAASGRHDRGLVEQVGEHRPGEAVGLAGGLVEIGQGAEGLVHGVDLEDLAAGPYTSGIPTWILRLKRPGRRTAESRTSSRFVAAITITSSVVPKPSSSTRSWLRVCSRSSWLFGRRGLADRVELVEEDHPAPELAGLGEEVADPLGADADVLLDELGAGCVVERDPGLGGDGPGEHRLARAGRSVRA